ncbi:DNA cytosine methyltransferase [Micromonospora sp. IBHARD004]|uniref:DNA cytosine methyltransferase n=1 Tax=Micromonospora sp. IBHARD004 TaxID=3457764 RepID=UPI0040582282
MARGLRTAGAAHLLTPPTGCLPGWDGRSVIVGLRAAAGRVSVPGYGAAMTASVVDLFSGGGGASAGFHAHPAFSVVGAADAQLGKPSSPRGSLSCNLTYAANMGLKPAEVDLSEASPDEVAQLMGLTHSPTVLIACPPCTGFSRTLARNHLQDDPRNGLVRRTALFVQHWLPDVVVMENARELVMGRFRDHLAGLTSDLAGLGYQVHASTHLLNRFGLPQKRERAVVIAVRENLPLRTMDDLWSGLEVDSKATHVRRAIWDLPALSEGEAHPADEVHVCPTFRSDATRDRIRSVPHDGGSWFDLAQHENSAVLLTPAMKHRLAIGDLGSHPDVYGRMWWDRPAPTIKRECSHVGNGRYAHPEQDRLCSVRELAILNGFPASYKFRGGVSNMYRHIGDAVPPLVSYQMASLVNWILTGTRPEKQDLVMPDTHLTPDDIRG